MLPVAHEPLRETKIERIQQLPKSLFGYGVGSGRPRKNVLGLQPALVGEKLECLHLLGADAATTLDDVENSLITRLEHQLGAL